MPSLSQTKNIGELSAGPRKPEGMGWRVGVSIVTLFGSVIAAILWLFFYAGSFNVYQNIAVIVVILLAFIAIMGATWASWGMRQKADWWSGQESRPGETSSLPDPLRC